MQDETAEKMSNGTARYHVPNLARGLRVMEYLATRAEGATLTDIVEDLDLPKNSIFRITTTLLDYGYLVRNPDTMRFRLTKKLLAFGLSAVSDENIIENAIDIMRDLRDATDTTAYLGTLYGASGVIIEQAPGGHPFKLSVDLGARFSLHSGAPGKAMLAYLPEDRREAVMKEIDFIRFNQRTITDLDDFRAEIKRIQRSGYALDRAEEFEGIHCVGAPILDQSGSLVAALWISGQAMVLPEEKFEEYGAVVKHHALRISKRLGYRPIDTDTQQDAEI